MQGFPGCSLWLRSNPAKTVQRFPAARPMACVQQPDSHEGAQTGGLKRNASFCQTRIKGTLFARMICPNALSSVRHNRSAHDIPHAARENTGFVMHDACLLELGPLVPRNLCQIEQIATLIINIEAIAWHYKNKWHIGINHIARPVVAHNGSYVQRVHR